MPRAAIFTLLFLVVLPAACCGEAGKTQSDAAKKEALKKAIEAAKKAADDATKSAPATPAVAKSVEEWETRVVLFDGTPPTLDEPVTGADYDARLKKILSRFDRTAMERDEPQNYLYISDVLPNMPAQKAGLRNGDIVKKINGAPVENAMALAPHRRPADAKLTVLGADGKEREVVLPGGRAGFSFGARYEPQYVWLKEGPRDPKWDDAVFAAYAGRYDDPQFAQSALLRAQKAGFKFDQLAHSVLATALQGQGRIAEATRYLQSVLKMQRIEKAPGYIAAEFVLYDKKASFSVLQRAGAATKSNEPSPIDKAKPYLRDSMLLRAPLPPIEDAAERRVVEQNMGFLGTTGGMALRMKPNHMSQYFYGPGSKNVELICRVSFDENNFTDGRTRLVPCVMHIGFWDDYTKHWNRYPLDEAKEDILHLARSRTNVHDLHTSVQNWPEAAIIPADPQLPDTLAKGSHLLHMLVLDGIGEIRLNGKRVFLGPVKTESGLLTPILRVRDMEYKFSNVQISELVSPADTKHPFFTEAGKPLLAGMTRMHWAAQRQTQYQVKALVEAGVKLDGKDRNGEWPIHSALRNGRVAISKYLKENGSPVDLSVLACLGTEEEVAAAVKAAPGEIKGTLAWSPLHGAAKYDNIAAVKILLDAGADVNARAKKNLREFSPLMWAAENGRLEIVKLLLARGANPAQTDSQNLTAYNYALVTQNTELIDLLKGNKGGGPSPAVRPPAPPSDEF